MAYPDSDSISHLLPVLEKLSIDPRLWVGSGIVTQSIWNYMCGYEPFTGINDVDIVFYDTTTLREWEPEVGLKEEKFLEKLFEPHFPIKLDVKNQALVHLWIEEKFGYAIDPYDSLYDSVKRWCTIATSIVARLTDGEVEYIAPYGFDDIYAMRVRRNPITRVSDADFKAKVTRWQSIWPIEVGSRPRAH